MRLLCCNRITTHGRLRLLQIFVVGYTTNSFFDRYYMSNSLYADHDFRLISEDHHLIYENDSYEQILVGILDVTKKRNQLDCEGSLEVRKKDSYMN